MVLQKFIDYCNDHAFQIPSSNKRGGHGLHERIVESVERNPGCISSDPEDVWRGVVLRENNGRNISEMDVVILDEIDGIYVVECKSTLGRRSKAYDQLIKAYEFLDSHFRIHPRLFLATPYERTGVVFEEFLPKRDMEKT